MKPLFSAGPNALATNEAIAMKLWGKLVQPGQGKKVDQSSGVGPAASTGWP